ncbi:MAG: NADH-quinone oxidoreductase subunit NuoF [Bacilli bacterium]|nr:NADH-quinone oxidoreductase subunit NuoF [Bacilli bacterium]MCH4210909.1 NADH-quinone oxidoreductase subunit NuoF [Bacilli bacterium]MCH4228112.1 NADH-quinone oxidoreductase subunit NuoF [Bacilli bacterium]MCH4278386.1 NADH-quinone oxidoreductase subunit NuoF [Bacilli bacterium]MCI2054582.1 NADH-quinone oxidoreductase subunit NuoF [Bacilli bacterium]
MVCGGTGCLANDSDAILKELEKQVKEKGLEDKVSVNHVGCFGFCSQGPFVKIFPEDTLYHKVKLSDVSHIVDDDLIGGKVCEDLLYVDPVTHEKVVRQDDINFYKKQKRISLHGCSLINPDLLEESLGYDGFKALKKVLTEMKPQEVIDEVLASGIRGRGGAGFPTGRKWQFAANQVADQKYIVCNGDEGDPGAFMDRSILEGNPFEVIEGMMIAGYAFGASQGYFYVRAEYPVAVERLLRAMDDMRKVGLLGDHILGTDFSFEVHLREGAGAFVCGEETALLNSIEGKRGMPRPRPPFPAIKGLWGKPTCVNNVETLAQIPYIIRVGAKEYAKVGTEGSKGTKVFALGGKINNVGLVEVPMGTTLRTLIFDIGGGIPNGKKFKAIQTGGPSGGCLTEEDLDTPIDYDTLIARGSMMGSGGAIVMDEDNCMVDVAHFYMDFICSESCGKCSPCRIGTKRLLEMLTRVTNGQGNEQTLKDMKTLATVIKGGALCALGQTAANPILSTMKKFPDEYHAHVVDKKCPAHVCKKLMQYYIDPSLCKKCSKCARNCPVSCISGVPGKEPYVINQAKCIKCGTCLAGCPFHAISKR